MAYPLKIYKRIGDLRKVSDKDFTATIAIYVDGFIEDAIACLKAIKTNTAEDVAIYVVITGTPELLDIAEQIDARTFITQITEGVGYGDAINALIKFANSKFVVVMDPSSIFEGDVMAPVIAELNKEEFCAVGWRGGLVNTEDGWSSVDDKGPGEVDVLFSYFLAVNRQDAISCGGFNARAIYYRNADIEFSLRLRHAQGRLLQMELPLRQERHHGYYDADETFRDEQSRKTYDRILDRFRGKSEILAPRR